MITLAATAATDVVVAIGSNNTATTTIAVTSPTTGSGEATGTAVTMIGTAATTNACTSPISATTIVATNNTNRTTAMTTTGITAAPKLTKIRRRHKVKEFNDLISCSLCSGYLINATTIDHCGDSFCRSCILQHMKTSKHCPKCNHKINLSNLGSDELLKALVYKLVPGLYHNEIQRQIQFTSDEKDEAVIIDSEDDFFSPIEPISLSLEYHPESLSNFTKDQIPPVRYLQCPAAVTVHHLQRLISSKFNLDMDNCRVDIEIIYEDKILPDGFSLMDVGYCFSWKKDTLLRLFYRILIHSESKNSEQVTNLDIVSSENKTSDQDEAIFLMPPKKEAKTVHFKESSKNGYQKQESINKSLKKEQRIVCDDEDEDDDDDDDASIIDDSYKNSKTTYAILKPKSIKNDDFHVSAHHNNNNNNNLSSKHRKDKDKHTSQVEQSMDSMKVTIITRKTGGEAKVKLGKNKSKRSSSPSKTSETASPTSDFKSLRSNDVRYMNDYTASLMPASTKHHKSKNATKETAKTTSVPKCDIFVSIPPGGHRSSNSSDDSSENLSLAQLKTASKKNSSNSSAQFKQSISLDESLLSKNKTNSKPDVPKLKITMSKKPPTAKVRKLSVEEQPIEHVDLTTYAKHIGLKPINPPPTEEKREIKLKISPGSSPSSSLSSSSASSPPSAAESGFVFNPDVSTSSHKKRKKAKHSKEPKESSSKKRRLHAEISSPAAEESLKLKVKITGNPKSYKAERKASSSSDEVIITSPLATIPSPIIASPTTTTTVDRLKLKASSPPMVNIPITSKLKADVASKKEVVALKSTAEIAKPNNIKVDKESTLVKVPSPPISVTTTKPASPRPAVSTNTQSTTASALVKPPPTKLQSIKDTKLPASPPLPPSLFKTAPMALQPLVLGPPKIPASPLMPKPRLQIRQPDPPRFKPTFAIPNVPPRPPMPASSTSPKLSPISSIASAANRQAQLKRSASLDGSTPTLAKQQKIEQDKLMRKASYAPFLNKMQKSPTVTVASAGPTGLSMNGLSSPPPQPKQRNAPISISTINQPKLPESSFYSSPVPPVKHTPFISKPASDISVTKMPDVCNIQSTPGLTITPQSQTPLLPNPINTQKPALEILRIQSNIPPIDQQKIPMTKPVATKTTRPMPPTIPLVKIKRSTNSVNSFKPTVTTVSSPIQQQAVLSPSMTPKSPVDSAPSSKPVNGLHNKVEPSKTVVENQPEPIKAAKSPTSSNVCDTSGVLDLSGKSSRSPSQDKPSPPLTPVSPNQSRAVQNLTLSSLEAALNKAKQQISQITPTPTSAASSATSSNLVNSSSSSTSSTTHSLGSTISSIGLNSSNLQNLKMLSESATSREKIAIKSPKPLAAMPKLNEISKVRQPAATVRQQNASVRNIPNPSALTLRGQQVPMLTSISKSSTTTVTAKTTTNSTVTTTASTLNGDSSQPLPLSPIATLTTSPTISSTTSFISSLAKPSSPIVSTTLTNSSEASKLLASKKNLHLEQLAASLNMRAAAAAGETAAAAKATSPASSVSPPIRATSNSPKSPTVSSSSTVTTTATLIASPLVTSASTMVAAVSTSTQAVVASSSVSTTSSATAVAAATTTSTSSGVASVTSSEPVVSASES